MKADNNIFRVSFDNVKHTMLKAYGQIVEPKNSVEINWSNIKSLLIKKAGQYCKNYASDILISIDAITDILNNIHIANTPMLFIMGFRESGVDHDFDILNIINSNTTNMLPSYVGVYYRDILAIEITQVFNKKNEPSECIMTVKDIRAELVSQIYKLQQNNKV